MQESLQASLTLKITFFLFINTKSGGELGRKYLTLRNRAIQFEYQKNTRISVKLIDLFDKESVEAGLNSISQLTSEERKSKYRNDVRVIICGGDGSVLWVVSLVAKSNAKMEKITFGIIPIGTGNDFSRSCGWGGSPIHFQEGNSRQLKALIVQWIRSDLSEYDIWDLSLTTYENGTIVNIRDKQEVDLKQKHLSREFCNYFGVGIDARICYSVEKRRQKNKFINLMLYGCIGVCKLFQRIKHIDKVVDHFSEGQNKESDEEDQVEDQVEEEKTQKKVSSAIKQKLLDEVKDDPSKITFKEGYCSLLCLNSTRYMAGLKNVWRTEKVGVQQKSNSEFMEQRVDDGMIEFLAFKSELRLGLERIINSGARIAQGKGPFVIKIKREQANYPTFIHIDGEAMKIYHPKEIVIKKSQTIPNGKIKVMMRHKQ